MSRVGTQQTGLAGVMATCGTTVSSQQGNQTVNNSSFRERVAKRAYEKWQQRGCKNGFDKQDWIDAERELLAEQYRQSSTGVSYQR